MSKRSIPVPSTMLQALVRAAIASLDHPGATLDVPLGLEERWLRNAVTRQHRRGSARYRVQARPTLYTIVRIADAPLIITINPDDTQDITED